MVSTRTSIVWEMGDLKLLCGQRSGRHDKVSVSDKGVLRIRNIGLEDAGVYTCIGQLGGKQWSSM